ETPRCAHSTLFALRAKALQSGAPDMAVSRKKPFPKTLCPSGGFIGAPENAKPFVAQMSPFSMEDATHPPFSSAHKRRKIHRPTSPGAGILPLPSRGENGGLCPHPPKG